ncbi:hypothetical protein [Cyprinid herpesvirus 2]|nr:hypothetical protein [Cyprinid herpesvirus 2]QIM55280.1 hypothetical protein [Cyprinid herpesvirus 2]
MSKKDDASEHFGLWLCEPTAFSPSSHCRRGSVSAVWKCLDAVCANEWDRVCDGVVCDEILKPENFGIGHLFGSTVLLGWCAGSSVDHQLSVGSSVSVGNRPLRTSEHFHSTILSDLTPVAPDRYDWLDTDDLDPNGSKCLYCSSPRTSYALDNPDGLPIHETCVPTDLRCFLDAGIKFAGRWNLTGLQFSTGETVVRLSRLTRGETWREAGLFHLTLRIELPKSTRLCCFITHCCFHLPRAEWMRKC